MRRLSLTLAVVFVLGACGGGDPEPEPSPAEAASESAADESPAAENSATPAVSVEAGTPIPTEGRRASPDAPAFAVIYPGGVIDESAAPTRSEAGPGGIVTYVTAASPDDVIAFHRARAEAEGLASVMAMNQGEARAYGAHSTADGGNLSVFATPVEDGGTSVQLVWSEGG